VWLYWIVHERHIFFTEKEVTFGDYSFNLNLNKNISKNFLTWPQHAPEEK